MHYHIENINVSSPIAVQGQVVEVVLNNDYQLTRKDVTILLAVTVAVTATGAALYAAGHNESFYSGSEAVRGVFEAITQLGNEVLYLVVLSLIYLSYDKRFGRRLCLLFFFMVYLTDFLKEFFRDPRPPSNLEREDPYTSYGFPSGHTTTSITFYGYIMLSHLGEARARIPMIIVCGLIVVLVPISRLIIGVHDVQDVVGGAVIALTILVAYMVLLPRVSPTVKSWSLGTQLGIGVPVALLIWLVGGMLIGLRHPGDVLIALEETSMGAGLLLGCAIAFPLEEALVGYRPELMTRVGRVMAGVIGLPVTVVVYVGMSSISEALLPGHLEGMLTYSMLLVVLTFLLPMVLKMFMGTDGPDLTDG
ncbi:MAG: phosphatase PAP2 family protein [Thermoplasmata archaeon]|nr:MAG: phosphatase PAP2 family protein [Thermoplasmata archaeon]